MTCLPSQTARIEGWSASTCIFLSSKDEERVMVTFDGSSIRQLIERMSAEWKMIKDASDKARGGQPR